VIALRWGTDRNYKTTNKCVKTSGIRLVQWLLRRTSGQCGDCDPIRLPTNYYCPEISWVCHNVRTPSLENDAVRKFLR
jgi:hypothetical protein